MDCDFTQEVSLLVDGELAPHEAASPSAGAGGHRLPAPRETAWGLWERLNEASRVRRLRPAHVVSLALLLTATALGLRWLAGSYSSPGTRRPGAPAAANVGGQPARATPGGEAGAAGGGGADR